MVSYLKKNYDQILIVDASAGLMCATNVVLSVLLYICDVI